MPGAPEGCKELYVAWEVDKGKTAGLGEIVVVDAITGWIPA